MEEQLLAFLSHLQQEYRYSENTIAAYRNDLSQFLEYVESHSGSKLSDWSAVGEEDIEAYLTYMKHKDQPYASSTIARKVAAIKSFYNYLAAEGIVSDNPTIDIDSPKVKKRLPQTLSPAEVERLLESPSNINTPKNLRDVTLLNILYETGMRVTEVVSIQMEDVDLKHAILSSPTRQGEAREIPLEDSTQALLVEYITEGRPQLAKSKAERALFLNHRGEKLTRQGLWLIIKGYARQAGLNTEVTPHTLRHSFAVHRLNKGSKLEDIQHLLGHANISTTQIYTQMEQVEEEEAPAT
ncbi:MAG: tyrosine recombinase [Anaerolineales bacterium]|uniref:site-specific tyrosine recombinase/integron integrase n=1 Tax=Promineifilum sp. TaxID=2664178 RepID=UPI001D386383|nr:tyrosine recombinase [Anaerolineales bacterium]MCO5179071.1 tyrosine recombinase [Promineifilum sp.]